MATVRSLSQKAWSRILFGSLVLFAVWSLPSSWGAYSGDSGSDLETIVIVAPWLQWTICVSGLLAGPALFVMACTSGGRPASWCPGVALLLSLTVYPMAGITRVLTNHSSWSVEDSISAADGETYVFCHEPGFVGSRLAIGRIQHDVLLSRYHTLVSAWTDSPRAWASVIRTDPISIGDHYDLTLTDRHVLVGLTQNACFLAYDLEHHVAWDYESIERLSPFICVGAGSTLHEPDIEEIRERIALLEPTDMGVPRSAILRRELDHPHPRVRKIAAELLEMIEGRKHADE